MRIERGLNPNCSEIAFNFNGVREIDTASPDDVKQFMLEVANELGGYSNKGLQVKDWDATFYDNIGGGGDWDYIRKACYLALMIARGDMLKEEAIKKLDDEKFNKMVGENFN